MRKTLLTLTSILFCVITFAQSVPQGINYQAVARDANGDELTNQSIWVRFSVFEGNPAGILSWHEIQQVTTNDFGLFTAVIGQGISTGWGSSSTFSVINWGSNAHYLKVEIMMQTGGTYIDMGTNQLLSVPYALQAGKSVFELSGSTHHDHLVCLKCGKVVEFEDDTIERRQEEIAKENGIKLTNHSLYLYGECEDTAACKEYAESNS